MSLRDCPRCYEHFCMCGYEYRHWPIGKIEELRSVLAKISAQRMDAESATRQARQVRLNLQGACLRPEAYSLSINPKTFGWAGKGEPPPGMTLYGIPVVWDKNVLGGDVE